MAYTCVRVVFEIGHVSTIRNEPTVEGFTHDWELFLRGADNTEIDHFIERVVFHLHESFPNHKRVIKDPPYVVYETGYAGFPLMIDIYLKNKHEPSRIRFHYHLTLQPKGPPLRSVQKERYVFKNPSEDFRRKLIKGGGVGVGADSASGSHTNHMAALNNDHSTDEHKSLNNKNKASPQDVSVSSKKSKKENTPKNEEQLSANDPFSIFGQPIKTSKIPLVSKSSSKNQISDKPPPQEKQSHSSKSSKHSSSSHKDKDKDKERGSGGGGGGGSEKEKTKDKDKNSMKRSSKESSELSSSSSSKKDKFKDDKVRILKVSSKEDSKKNSYHEEKSSSKEKSSSSEKSSSAMMVERSSSTGRSSADNNTEMLKFEKKEKDKKHKDEKKSKSKDKYKQNEKKENIDVVMKESYVNERSEKLFSNKDDYKEEKKFHRIANSNSNNNADDNNKDNKAEKISSKDKGAAIAETKNLFNNVNNNNNNNSSTNNNNSTDSQIINNGDNTQRSKEPAEVKHKHHKHKKDKSKKDSKRDKEERKEKKESKENKERFSMESQQQQQQQPQQQQHVQPQQPATPATQAQPPAAVVAAPQSRSTPKSGSTDSPRRLKKPVKALFELDNSDSEFSSMDDDLPPPSLPPAHHRLMPAKEMLSSPSPSPEMNLIKEEPMSGYNKREEQTKEEKYETPTSKKKKKNSEERENKKRKRKSKDKEENATSKMIKYETNCSQAADLAGKPADPMAGSDRTRQSKSVSPSEPKFTDEYITKLKELQRKIMTLEDNSGLQRIVQVVAETGQYEITTKTFDFDLCTLDESIVQRLLDFFVP
ncbi:protein AF-9 isoform X1 [Planococcus citri]|uniref:protein AF-9 isoform X1 n=2 Tax=Planococcus citri TaxID=170843 RepID=UPI0031F99C43